MKLEHLVFSMSFILFSMRKLLRHSVYRPPNHSTLTVLILRKTLTMSALTRRLVLRRERDERIREERFNLLVRRKKPDVSLSR